MRIAGATFSDQRALQASGFGLRDFLRRAREAGVDGVELPAAEQHGIVLALENHFGITRTAADTVALAQAVDSPWFRVNVDTGNFCDDPMTGAHPFEDVYEAIEALAPLMVFCHAKIRGLTPGRDNDSVLDYHRIFSILRAAEYRGYISIEYVGQDDPTVAMPAVVTMLRSCWAGSACHTA